MWVRKTLTLIIMVFLVGLSQFFVVCLDLVLVWNEVF